MQHVFIIGSKGIPAKYGGYETFVEQLTKRKVSSNIKYHVACMAKNNNEFEHNGARCFNVNVPSIGPAKAIYYDCKAFKKCLKYIKQNKIEHPIIYVLTCRIGPFYKSLVKRTHKLGGLVYLNPDGHEWMRAKWSKPVRKYWKHSEKLMVKHSDLVICDSINIQKYVDETYGSFNKETTYIAYGADTTKSSLADDSPELIEWLNKHDVKPGQYYLSVGRFVPENNFEVMIREFMKSNTSKDFVLVTNVEKNKLYTHILNTYHFERDKRIKFVGTIYNEQLLKKIRELSFAYIHGHSVGGTNPSLLEALASTKINILFDVGFNRECGNDSAFYFGEKEGELANILNNVDCLSNGEINRYDKKSNDEIDRRYSWELIVEKYERVFLG